MFWHFSGLGLEVAAWCSSEQEVLQVFLEFESAFWEEHLGASTQQFGVMLAEGADSRGFCSNFWNFKPFTGANILCGLLTGSSATLMESMDDATLVARAVEVLKTVFPTLPQVARSSVTRWGEDPFAYGSYSFVGIGGRGDHYDLMARPIGRTLLFCGEGTSKEHLDTVGGAILTGRREVSVCFRTVSRGIVYTP
jgi:monoamine oxidase